MSRQNQNIVSKEEYKFVEKAAQEFFKQGVVTTRCPRCATTFEVDVIEGAYEVRCSTSGCIRVVFRGI